MTKLPQSKPENNLARLAPYETTGLTSNDVETKSKAGAPVHGIGSKLDAG